MVSFTIKVRKFFLSIAFLFLIAVCLGDIEASDRKTVTIIVNSATLREKPAFDSKPVTWAAKGAVFEAIEKFTDRKGKRWYKVRTSGGKECWIKEVAVKVSEPESADSQAQDKKVESASGDTEKHKAEDKIKEKSEGDAKKRAGENKHGKTAAVIIDAAPLRTRPFIVFSPVASGKKGAVYEVTGEYTGSNGRKWYKVRVSKDREYWLEGKAVKIKEETKGEPEGEKPRKEEPKTDIKTQDRKAEPADDSAKPKAVEKAKEKKEKNGKEGIQKEQLSDRSLPELLAKADAFYKEGKCEDFISSYKKAIDIAARQNDTETQGKLHFNIAECYTRLGKYKDALQHLDKAISLARASKNSELEILALIDKSRVLIISGNKEKAAGVFKTVSEKADNEIFLNPAAKDYMKALVPFQMAGILSALGEQDRAKEKLDYAMMSNFDFKMEEDIIDLLKTVDMSAYEKISDANKMLAEAWALYEKGDYPGMGKVARTALYISKKLNFKKGMFGSNYYIAISFINMDLHDDAIDHVMSAQELAEKGNDPIRLGMVYNLAGNIFKQKKEYEKALHFYNKNLDIVKRTGNREGEAVALNNIGNVLLDKGEYKEALKHYEASLKISLEIGKARHLIAQGHLSVGRALKRLAEYKEAEKHLISAIKIFKEVGNEGGELIGLWELAGIYGLQGRYDEAIRILEDNLDRSGRYGLKQNFIDDLVNYAEKTRDFLRVEDYLIDKYRLESGN